MNGRKTLGDILVFLFFLIALSGVSYTLVLHAANLGGVHGGTAGRIFSIALMWSPGTAALITLWMHKGVFASIGWTWGENRWNVAAYLLPLGYSVLAYSLVWIFGLGTLGDAATITSLAYDCKCRDGNRP